MTMKKLAIYTADLTNCNGYRMPWRTALEIVSNWNKQGIEAVVFSGTDGSKGEEKNLHGVRIINVTKPKDRESLHFFADVCKKEAISCLYYSRSWANASTKILELEDVGLKIIWYIPGAWYHFKQALFASKWIGIKFATPYIAQSLMPRRFYVKCLCSRSPRHIITMSDYVRDKLIACGYPIEYVHAILPGKAAIKKNEGQPEVFDHVQKTLAGRPYYLFFGPPQAIRGLEQILTAFKKIATIYQDICLVCLFRSDKGLQADKLRSDIKQLGLEGRLFCIWQSVSEADLDAFLENCYAVLKPFLLVPSEIPLAVIEAAGYAKPVITTGPDGTGLFARQFGLMVPIGNAKALAEAMLRLLSDKNLYSEKCSAANLVYKNHPTWDEVAEKWLAIGSGN